MCFNRPKAPDPPKPIAVPPTPPPPPAPKPLKPPKPVEKETKPNVQYGSKKKATKPGERTGVNSLRIPLNVPTAAKNGGLNVKG
jgi:hypothetical protein